MLDSDKVYEFTIGFGGETSTLDAEGEAVATSDVRPTLAEVEALLTRFTGEIEQVPPAYSALMVEGKRAYDRARAGEDVEKKTRRGTVYELLLPHTRFRGDDEVPEHTLIPRDSQSPNTRSLAPDTAQVT